MKTGMKEKFPKFKLEEISESECRISGLPEKYNGVMSPAEFVQKSLTLCLEQLKTGSKHH